MFEQLLTNIQPNHILMLLSFALIAMLIAQCIHLRNRIEKINLKLEQAESNQARELKVVNQGAIGVGQRLLKIEKKMNTVLRQQSQLALNDPGHLNYQHALSMMQSGLDKQQVMKTCGLVQGEAELIQSLNNKRRQKDLELHLNNAIT